mmetsp:Transcript_1164/g.1927  ORF Transcript_1164/g.1927 Transcript_1164/m.1927 type:complete len:215 (-) Transcript_1164:13-657(-)
MNRKAAKPNQIPLEMEWLSGIRATIKKLGSAILISCHSMSPMSLIISVPIKISTGADAASGTSPRTGVKNRERANRNAAVKAVTPVFPPSTIPEVHSTAMMIGEHPVIPAIMVPIPEAQRAQTPPGTSWLTSVISPALRLVPRSTPEQSKSATRRKVITAGSEIAGEVCSADRDIAIQVSLRSGSSKTCLGHESASVQIITATATTPRRMAPLT